MKFLSIKNHREGSLLNEEAILSFGTYSDIDGNFFYFIFRNVFKKEIRTLFDPHTYLEIKTLSYISYTFLLRKLKGHKRFYFDKYRDFIPIKSELMSTLACLDGQCQFPINSRNR